MGKKLLFLLPLPFLLLEARTLTIDQALEQGLRKNFAQQDRQYQQKMIEYQLKDIKADFWPPNVSLRLETSPHRIMGLKEGKKNTAPGTSPLAKGSLVLDLGEYTIFNWGKDYLNYLGKRSRIYQENRVLEEKRRTLRHQIILAFAKLIMLNSVKDALKKQLRQAAFVYRLNKEKAHLKKIPVGDFYLARGEFLRAKGEYEHGVEQAHFQSAEMAALIADPPGINYTVVGQIKYQKMGLVLEKGLELGLKSNDEVYRAEEAVLQANLNQTLVRRENMPLPKITLNLGAYRYFFDERTRDTAYEIRAGNTDLEVIATVKATWPIWGKGGIFNRRKFNMAQQKSYRATNQLAQAKHFVRSEVDKRHRRIKFLETQMAVARSRQKNITKSFDLILEGYFSGKAPFADYSRALVELAQAEINLATTRWEHFKEKVTLAEKMGVEDFADEVFQQTLSAKGDEVAP